jgi:hypothetical protein
VHPVLCLDSRAPCCALEKGAMVPRPVGVPVSRSGAARQETTGRSGQGKCMHARPEPVSRLETMRRGKRGGTATAFSCRIAEGGRPFRCRLIPVGWSPLAGSGRPRVAFSPQRRGGSVRWPDTGTLAGRGSSAGDDDDGRVRVPGEERAERGHEAWEKAAVGAVDEGIVPPGHGTTGGGRRGPRRARNRRGRRRRAPRACRPPTRRGIWRRGSRRRRPATRSPPDRNAEPGESRWRRPDSRRDAHTA